MAQTNQTAAMEDFKPSSVNQPGKQYSQVNSGGRVRVSIAASRGQRVQLDIGGAKYTFYESPGTTRMTYLEKRFCMILCLNYSDKLYIAYD